MTLMISIRESTGSAYSTFSQSSNSTNSTRITIGALDSFVAKPLAIPLGGQILNNESKILENEMSQKLKDDPVGITLSFDGWTNVLNQNILGSVFITSEGKLIR
ncbi:hypothetical protein RhiirA1_456662 [Rhizophagus irregularis]|uniref:DUF659 domain-containing protein n=1 Tax=Rhizophagus irregularis TaxID=588596 RepID=A0A2N0S054_9GLOM|nr:hypothetical protein RhiirA1_456662 [Rhizophagus irregularis]